jgi:hypothetical protein
VRSQTGSSWLSVPITSLSQVTRGTFTGAERGVPAINSTQGSPWAGADKNGWHLPGVQEGCWLGQVDAVLWVSRRPCSQPLNRLLGASAGLSRWLSWCGGRAVAAVAGESACVCARPEPLQHLCIKMCSSLSPAPLTGWLRSGRRWLPLPPPNSSVPTLPALPHLLSFKDQAAA